jgi:putative radical SAM enzyme (TIGR03279 family)
MALLIIGSEGKAREAGIEAGSRLVSINGEPVLDFVDYHWFSAMERLDIEIEAEGRRRRHRVLKRAEEPIGLELDGLYPAERRCANRCVFCFVDQTPAGMRESLYVKDDDWRYSVLFGNYITLTNVKEAEFRRILRRQPSPLYVSVHATDPDVRARLMGNPAASAIMEQLKRLAGAGIFMHCQVVLVPGWNDGAVLDETLNDLYALYPGVRTAAVVPVGLTAHRQGLTRLEPVKKADAAEAVEAVERISSRSMAEHGVRFAFASDEMIERAGLPPKRYEGGEYAPQLANGVGLASELLDDFEWALGELPGELRTPRRVTIATGVSAAGLMEKIASELMRKVRNLTVGVWTVENGLFGPQVTVAGLIAGADILRAAAGRSPGDALLVPRAALKSGEDIFLDGMSTGYLSEKLGASVAAVPCDGAALAYAACGLEENLG